VFDIGREAFVDLIKIYPEPLKKLEVFVAESRGTVKLDVIPS